MRARDPLACALTALLVLLPTGAVAQRASDLTVISQSALERGVVTCLAAIERLTVALAAEYRLGAYFFNQLDEPNKGLLSISLELSPSRSGSPVHMSASFVSVEGACQAMVETTVYWDSSCDRVGLAYPGYQSTGKLLEQIDVFASNRTERNFIIPTLKGTCISVEKTVYF